MAPCCAGAHSTETRFNEVVEIVDGHLEQVVPPPIWNPPALGIDSTFQRRGFGTALMRRLMLLAATDEIPAVWSIWSMPNVKRCKGLGAEVVGEGASSGPRIHYWLFRWATDKQGLLSAKGGTTAVMEEANV